MRKLIKPGNRNVFIVMVIMLLLVIAVFFSLKNSIYKNLNSTTETTIQEITKGSIKLIEAKVKGLSSSLEVIALLIGEQDNIFDENGRDIMHQYSQKYKNSNLIVINKEGKSYSEMGIEYDVSDRGYFKEVLEGKPVVSNSIISKFNNEEVIVLAVPIYKNEEIVGALAGVYRANIFTEIISVDAFDSKEFSFILKKNGRIIAKPEGAQYWNIFEEILSLKIVSDYEQQDLKKNIENNKSGVFKYVFEDKVRYASYAPIGINDWFIVSIIPSDIMDKQNKEVYKITVSLMVATLICCSVFIYCVFFMIQKNHKETRKKLAEISEIVKHMSGAVKQTLVDKEYSFLEYTEGFLNLTGYIKEEINTLFDNKFTNMIYTEDKQKLEISIQNQLRSSKQIENEYRIRKKDGSLIWVLDKGQLVVDEYGREILYCNIVDITSQKETLQQLEYEKEKYKTVLNISDDILFEYDIQKDEIMYSQKYKSLIGREPIVQNYKQKLYESNSIFEEDYGKFVDLIENINEKDALEILELRVKKEDGFYIYFLMQAKVIRDKDNKPIKLIGKLSNIDKERKQKDELLELSERDTLTHLYNKRTTQNKIEYYISDKGKDCKNALLIINIDNFKEINDELGHIFGDETLKIVASKIEKMFRTADIVGRIGGGEFLVFMKDIRSEDIIIRKSEAIYEIFRSAYEKDNKELKVSGSVGISVYPKDGSTYKEIFENANSSLYNVKAIGKDTIR